MSYQSVFGTKREVVDLRDLKSGHFSAFLSLKILKKGENKEKIALTVTVSRFSCDKYTLNDCICTRLNVLKQNPRILGHLASKIRFQPEIGSKNGQKHDFSEKKRFPWAKNDGHW